MANLNKALQDMQAQQQNLASQQAQPAGACSPVERKGKMARLPVAPVRLQPPRKRRQ